MGRGGGYAGRGQNPMMMMQRMFSMMTGRGFRGGRGRGGFRGRGRGGDGAPTAGQKDRSDL